MYIHPFILGIVATLAFEFLLLSFMRFLTERINKL